MRVARQGKGDKLIQFVQVRIGVTGVAGVTISRRSGRFLPGPRNASLRVHAGRARSRASGAWSVALDSDGKLSQKYAYEINDRTGALQTDRRITYESVERTIARRKGNRP